MDEDFFGDETPQQFQGQPENVQEVKTDEHHGDNDFNFEDTEYQAPQMVNHTSNHSQNSHNSNQYGSYTNLGTTEGLDNETANKIREEEDRIQENLREKSNAEYELKNKRRENARKQYEEFQEKKEEETVIRKRENRVKQEESIKRLSTEQGSNNWKKVAENIQLKQSENQGKKDINRMREAIINKKADEK